MGFRIAVTAALLAAVACAGCASRTGPAVSAAESAGPTSHATTSSTLERFKTNGGCSQAELEALSPSERDTLAVDAEALLTTRPPPTTSTVTRVQVALAHAWSPRAEILFARLSAHHDPLVRYRAHAELVKHGLSKMAFVRDAVPEDADSDVLRSVVATMGLAADVEPRALAEVCSSVRHDDDVDWQCKLEIARAGDASGLGRKMNALAQTGDFYVVEERLQSLVALEERGPWRELADQVHNGRFPPEPNVDSDVTICGNAAFERARRRHSLGDSFVRAIALATSLKLSFVPAEHETFTRAQRAEVKRKLLASR